MNTSMHTPENPNEPKDARTPGLDEILIYDAVQRLVHRVDKQAAEIEALREARARLGKFDPHPPRIVVDANGYVWRDYGDYYSMCPVNPDNEQIKQPVTYYEPAQLVFDQGEKKNDGL